VEVPEVTVLLWVIIVALASRLAVRAEGQRPDSRACGYGRAAGQVKNSARRGEEIIPQGTRLVTL